MLSFIPIRSFFTFYVFLYIILYILNIARTKKRCLSMNSENLSLKSIIKELDFLGKTIIIHGKA